MTFAPLEPQERRSLGTRVYESIREGIVSLQAEPGAMLYENELAQSLNVSRTPIREAIRMLVGDKLIEVLPQRGTRIARISLIQVSEARFVREQLETGAFRMAARMWKLEDRSLIERRLAEILANQREAAEQGDMYRFLQEDEAFHRQIMGVAGNSILLDFVDQMRAHISRMRLLALREFRHVGTVLEEHAELLDAVRQGEEARTVSILHSHIGKLEEELPLLISTYPQYFKDL